MNYNTEQPEGGVPIKMWTRGVPVEDEAKKQLANAARLPIVFKHIAAMPDVHLGIGATVGSVIPTLRAIIPAAVGVDIGCGMMACKTTLHANDLPDNLAPLRTAIERAVPHGSSPRNRGRDQGSWENPPDAVDQVWATLVDEFDALCELHPRIKNTNNRKHLGTLGGGNHFIEICLDTQKQVWVMLHSGSRGIGNLLAQHHIAVAQGLAHNQTLPDPDLAVFLANTPQMKAYRHDLFWAQDYARRNRAVMLRLICDVMRGQFPQIAFETPISAHHNYAAEETHFGEDVLVTRKGAIRAGRGELGIIPGSMGTGSYIVRGLGNPDSFESASHGAGRRMSRNKARKQFTEADLAAQTAGVECRKDAGVVDEIPAAYKDIDEVIRNQDDLVEVVAKLKQVICIKG